VPGEYRLWMHVLLQAIKDAAAHIPEDPKRRAQQELWILDARRFLTTPRRIGPLLEILGISCEAWFDMLRERPKYRRDWERLARRIKRFCGEHEKR
jgi:hypothetical protein